MYLMPAAAPEEPAWSSSARALSTGICVEGAIAVAVLAQGAPGPRLALAACLVAVVMLPLIVRARMPMAAKTLLAVASLTATLAIVASADLFGLRAIEQAVVTAPVHSAPNAPVTVAPVVPAARPLYLAVRGTSDPIAQRVADDLAIAMQQGVRDTAGLPQIEGVVTRDPGGFAMRWAIARSAIRRPCGDLRVFGADDAAAVAAFRDAMLGAIVASRSGELACYPGATV